MGRFVDGKMEIDTTINENWMEELKKAIPDKSAKIIVGDIDGRTHAMDCLMALNEEGYENMVASRAVSRCGSRPSTSSCVVVCSASTRRTTRRATSWAWVTRAASTPPALASRTRIAFLASSGTASELHTCQCLEEL